MIKQIKYIAIFFVLMQGVLSNSFAIHLVHDGSELSIEKRAVECERIKEWE